MYSLQVSDNKVILRTTSYQAERGSVLHSGIYSRELAASLFSGAIVVVFLFLVAIWHKPTWIHFVVAAGMFALMVPVSRYFIFREPELITVFDLQSKQITINLKAPLKSRSIIKPIDKLQNIKVYHKRYEVENPDAVAFVKKIALQHGQVMPDFGNPQEFHTLILEFEDEKIPVLTLKDSEEILSFADKLKKFLRDYLTSQ